MYKIKATLLYFFISIIVSFGLPAEAKNEKSTKPSIVKKNEKDKGKKLPKIIKKNKTLPKIVKKPKHTISSILDIFKFENTNSPKIQFEIGMLAYSTSTPHWDLVRLEPFVKMHWAVLGKYLQPYVLISIDSSSLNYKINNWNIGSSTLAMNLKLKSSGNPSMGGGLKLFVFGWRGLAIHIYMQMQISSLNDASSDKANLKLNNTNFDISEVVANNIDVSYSIRRYDVGATFRYQFFKWFQLYTSLGYINFDITIKINMDDALLKTIRSLTNLEATDLIPKRIGMPISSFFGVIGMQFKIYKRFYLKLEGTIVPEKNPIYFGQFSFVLQGAS